MWPAAYTIETPRLALRCFEPGDAPALVALLSAGGPERAPWVDLPDGSETVDDMMERVRAMRGQFDLDEDYNYALVLKDGGALAGSVSVTPRDDAAFELGGWVAAEHARGGLFRGAVAALIRVAFDATHEVRSLELRCDPANAAVARVAAHLGFQHEGTLRRRYRVRDERRDQMIWVLHDVDYHRDKLDGPEVIARDALGRRLL